LWKDAGQNATAAAALKMHVEDLLRLGIVDHKIAEPLGGAHLDPQVAFANVKSYILESWNALKGVPSEVLLENRYQKFRNMGKFESASSSGVSQ
jgi:acetyl-CoA carboxylase carboxyl transferase subunit alpha